MIYEEDPTDMYLRSFLCYYGGLLEEQGGAYKDACIAFVMFPYNLCTLLSLLLPQGGKRRRKKDSEVYEHGLLMPG